MLALVIIFIPNTSESRINLAPTSWASHPIFFVSCISLIEDNAYN